jgi:hypothetical protein
MLRSAPSPERKTAYPELIAQYRAIGPAAILAALICASKTRPGQSSVAKAA